MQAKVQCHATLQVVAKFIEKTVSSRGSNRVLAPVQLLAVLNFEHFVYLRSTKGLVTDQDDLSSVTHKKHPVS